MPSLQELLTSVPLGEARTIDIAGGDKDRKLTVENRKLLPEEPRAPIRAESLAREHVFFDAPGFARYLARYGKTKKTVIFADPSTETIHAVLDEDAEDGFEIVSMKPQPHPLFVPWAALDDERLTIERFASFVDQHRRTISKPPGVDLSFLLAQIRASVKIEIQKGRGKKAINGLVITTEVTSANGQAGSQRENAELPDEITVHTALYVGTDAQDVELDLCIEADTQGNVSVLISSGTIAEARVRAFEDMVKVIRDGTKDLDATVTFGRPSHKAWAYLPELDKTPK